MLPMMVLLPMRSVPAAAVMSWLPVPVKVRPAPAPVIVVEPVRKKSPETARAEEGEVVPMPTLPAK